MADRKAMQKKTRKSAARTAAARRESDHQTRLNTAISECAQRFAASRNLDLILRDAVIIIRDHIGVDRAGIFLYDAHKKEWHGMFGTDETGRLRDERGGPVRFDPHHPISRAETGEGDEFFVENFAAEFPEDASMKGAKNLFFIALRAHGHLLGGISVDNLPSGRRITEETREDLRRLGRYVALALENLQLMDRLEEKNVALSDELQARTRLEREREVVLAELRRANEELTDFAHVVSHDLKAPLQKISSLAEWLHEDYGSRLDTEGRNTLARVQVNAVRMGELIDGILTYSRTGREGAKLSILDSDKLAREVVESLSPGPGVRIILGPHLPVVVYDETQLRQLFQNLINNAITHMGKPEGTVFVSCQDADDFWEFSVRDTGVGIEEKYLDRIFKMFQSFGTPDGRQSTGIGLAVVKKIVESNGGQVSVDSRIGEGSIFYFTIPKRVEVEEDL